MITYRASGQASDPRAQVKESNRYMTASPRPTAPRKRSAARIIGRVVWTTVKIFIIPVLCLAALIAGMTVGYHVIGGRPVSEVFEWNTWKHMFDLVFANT